MQNTRASLKKDIKESGFQLNRARKFDFGPCTRDPTLPTLAPPEGHQAHTADQKNFVEGGLSKASSLPSRNSQNRNSATNVPVK